MKIKPAFICILTLLLLPSIKVSASSAEIHEINAFQNSTSSEAVAQSQSNSDISDDSLQEIVPYLDDIEADTENELFVIYMVLIAFSTFFSEDLAAIGAGLMSANAMIPFWPAAIAVILGIYIGDFSLYLAGRWFGKPVLKFPPFKWLIKEEMLESSVKWFKIRGPYILVISRFIPGSRMPVYISAGILETGFWTFLLYFGGTVLLWTPIFVWISMLMGNELLVFYEKYEQYAIWVILAGVLIFYGLYKIIPFMLTAAGRRLAWRKLRNFFNK